jgi:hypothetical protein
MSVTNFAPKSFTCDITLVATPLRDRNPYNTG